MDASEAQSRLLVARLTVVVAMLIGPGSGLGVSSASASSARLRVPSLSWSACRAPDLRGFACATARVPLDYRHPGGTMIRLAVIRRRATDRAHRLGTLFFNPGGPHDALVPFARRYQLFPAQLRARFDLVSWDPRGTGQSTAVQCFASQSDEDRFFAGVPVGTFPVGKAQMSAWIGRMREFGRRCARRNGALLRHVSTADIARDLDLLRRAVGARWMNYLGISYGTVLGATYANMFPGRIRAMAVDGNVNPAAYVEPQIGAHGGRFLGVSLRKGDDLGSAKTLRAFLDLCGRVSVGRCAFSAGSPAATRAKWGALLARLRRNPPGSQMTYAELVSGTVSALYTVGPTATHSGWSAWAQQLQTAWAQGALRRSASSAAASSRYKGSEQSSAILCSDSPNPLPATYPAQDAFAYRRSAAVGPYWVWLPEVCGSWPVRPAERYAGPWNRQTAATVLVIGNTYDPATSYQASIAMSHQLARSRLLTVDGYGHTVFDNPSTCANRYESAYFINGSLPPRGASCRQDQQPFATGP